MRSALVLVDLQVDYLETSGLVPGADEVVRAAARLLEAWRARGLPIVHVHTRIDPADDRRMPHWRARGSWRCVVGTPGASSPPSLAPRAGEVVVVKTYYDGFASGELERALRAAGCDRIVIAGVHEHACVRATALAAYERGFEVVVAEDATASDDPLHALASRRWLEGRAARHANVRSILAWFEGPDAATGAPPDDLVIARARAAQGVWSTTSPATRRAALERVAAGLADERDSLARAILDAAAKPITLARAEVDRAIELVRVAADLVHHPTEAPRGPGSHARWRPHGVVLAVTPWNNPLAIPIGKVAPALALGNAVVLKPSPRGLTISHRLARILEASGVPDGLFALAPGDGATARALMEHPGIDAVTVTGSIATGLAAQAICARRFVPLQAELGGNNAAIVWPPADIDVAARAVAIGAFAFAGQRCTANRRVIVPRADLEALLAALVGAARALPWGAPDDPTTVVGPIVDEDAADRIRTIVRRASDAGLRVIPRATTSGDPHGSRDVAPTIVIADDPRHPIVQEESFGPLLVVQPADDFDHALRLVEAVPQGLAAALFGGNEAERRRFLDTVHAGILKLDRATSDADAVAPFGGWKASGLGPPEHGPHDRDFHARVQAIYEEPS